MSEQIDWSKAPKWAKKHGLSGAFKSPVWFDDEKYTYVDGQQDGKEFFYADACTYATKDFYQVSERPSTPSWSGEGLPPVGVVCEVAPDNSLWGFSTLEIRKCLVIAYHDDFVWLDTFVPGIPVATRVDKVTFRPIRTPEQIAADELEAAILDMERICRSGDFGSGELAALYDAGYRKP